MSLALYNYLVIQCKSDAKGSSTAVYSAEDLVSEAYLKLVEKGVDKPSEDALDLIHETVKQLKSKRGRSYISFHSLPQELNPSETPGNDKEHLKEFFIYYLKIDQILSSLENQKS